MQQTRADLDKISAEVQAMFDGVAERYDLLNAVLSLGQEKRWRHHTLAALQLKPGERVLDLAAGTGTSSVPYQLAGASVFPTDYSMGMLQVGKKRQPQLSFVRGDALALPYADGSFDAVTISYGLRNVEDTAGALREMHRVTRPGGRLVIAEFSTPVQPWLRLAYVHGALKVVPVAAKLSSNPVAYSYLAESILAWPNQQELAELIAGCGWRDVEHKNLTGGVVALHRARK
ncbi:MAG: demethylmenaquinone methyltransferase [Propionibacteriaceae bacterium]|nr:demethylmenaquinone methyltransferase [Propionibacteriaceae bacterium]